VSLFQIAGGQTCSRVNFRHAHKINIGVNAANGLDGRCANSHHRVLKKPPAKQDYLDICMCSKFHGNRGAVRDDGRPKIGSGMPHCDAVLRVPGESAGADQDGRLARERGLPVYFSVEGVPGYPNKNVQNCNNYKD
jgi:hypothetical protein